MKTNITRTNDYSLASVTQRSDLAFFTLTVDISSEVPNNTAIFIVFEDILLAGTKTHTRNEFMDTLSSLGASLKINIEHKLCRVTLKSPSKTYKSSLSLLFSALYSPAMKKTELERIIRTQKNILEQEQDNSRYISHSILRQTLFTSDDRRYEQTIPTIMKNIDTVSKQDLILVQKELLNNFWYITVGGNSTILQESKKQLAINKKKSITSETQKSSPAKTPKKLVLQNIPSRQNIDINIGSTLPITLYHDDYPAFVMALAILGKWGGFAGRLMSTVREKEGLTYSIYCKAEGLYKNESSYWRIMTFFSPEKTVVGLTSTFRELKKLYNNGVSDSELTTFKTILATQQALLNDSLGGKIAKVHSFQIQDLSIADYEDLQIKLQNLTSKEVNLVIKKYLIPDTLTVSCAGPIEGVKKEINDFIKSV